MTIQLLEDAYRYLGQPAELIYCTHDGDAVLHPPCYGSGNDAAIVDRCVGHFSTGWTHEGQPLWSKRQQSAALDRWKHHSQRDGCPDLDLDFFLALFDDFFFSCAPGFRLGDRVRVVWTEHRSSSPPPSCSVKLTATTSVLIQIPKPTTTTVQGQIQATLSTLLHSLAHAFLLLHSCPCHSCRCPVTRAATVGVTGHGPLWVRLCAAMEAEAGRRFGGWGWGGFGIRGDGSGSGCCWDLDCGPEGASVRRERRARERFERRPLVREELGRRAGMGGER